MGLTGALKQVSLKICPHCHKEYGKHSKKGFMKCLYTANYNLYNVVIELNELKSKQPLELEMPRKLVVDKAGDYTVERDTQLDKKYSTKLENADDK